MWQSTEVKTITAGMDLAAQHFEPELLQARNRHKCTSLAVFEGSVLQPSVQAFIVQQE